MIVTAQGFETKDLDTPAAVEVYDVKRIEESGANNAFDVLQNILYSHRDLTAQLWVR